MVRGARDKGYGDPLQASPWGCQISIREERQHSWFCGADCYQLSVKVRQQNILKIAMIQLDKTLVAGGYQTKMLLQVHDEIVLEVPKSELEMKSGRSKPWKKPFNSVFPLITE